MKECPKCKTVYTDVTLSFCLSDGTPLVVQIEGEEKTKQFSNPLIETEEYSIPKDNLNTEQKTVNETSHTNLPTQETVIRTKQPVERKRVSPVWIFATFGLLGILVLGGVSFWMFSDSFFKNEIASKNTNANVTYQHPKNENINSSNKETNTNSANSKPKPTKSKTPNEKPTATVPPKTNLYKVVGVKGNDVLYIRPQPGNLKVSVGKIPPNAKGIKRFGGSKKVGKSRWVLISYSGKQGWINSRFIARQ